MKKTVFYLLVVMLMSIPSITHTRAATASTPSSMREGNRMIGQNLEITKSATSLATNLSSIDKRVKDCYGDVDIPFVGRLGYYSNSKANRTYIWFTDGEDFWYITLPFAIC